MAMSSTLTIRPLGLADYEPTWRAMQRFTDERGPETADEIWWLEHPPVYTLGTNTDPAHLLATGEIPVIQIDRGGQVTYHGPGQLVVYPLLQLDRYGLTVRGIVSLLEDSLVELLAEYGLEAQAKADAPGVYIADAKIASLGLRIRRGCSYHGLAINVDNDLSPFARINPCGFRGLEMTGLSDHGINESLTQVAERLLNILQRRLTSD